MRLIRYAFVAALTLTAAGAGAQTTPALDATARALGGKDRIIAIRTLVLEGTGESLNFGQNHTPYAESRFEITALRWVSDFATRRWFMDLTRVPRFPSANMAPQRQRFGLDGYPEPVAYNVGNSGAMSRASAQVANDRLHEWLHHPVGFLKAAYTAGTRVVEEPVRNNVHVIRITLLDRTFTMVVDAGTRLPLRIERMASQPMLGDVMLITDFADWRDASGIRLPMRMTGRYENLFTLTDYRFSRALVDADVGNIAATDSVRSVVAQAGLPAAPTVVVDTIAPGVWSIAGQSHHTIAIEQSNRLVLVEAPQNDARTLAAIARARQLNPARRVEMLINTHHHFDHSGGLRAAISEGLTILTHQGNREFYEKVVYQRPRTIQLDAQAENPKGLDLIAIRDRHAVTDSVRPIEVYPIEGSAHSGSMLVVYLPKERVLIQADLYNPPAPTAVNPVFPFAANLVQNIERLRLQVDRVVGIHGRPVPYSQVQAAASRTP